MSQNTASNASKRFCTGCGVALTPGVQFCSACGTPIGGTARAPAQTSGGQNPAPWIVAGVLTVIAVAAVIYAATDRTEVPPPAVGLPAAAGGGLGQAPDISNMTPREQFTRLSDRVTSASENGDTATVINFTPMALGAYANLPPGDRDIDARYHTAMIHTQVGQFPEALALADTILAESPNDLFAYFIQAIVADFQGAGPKAEAARANFKKHFDAEMAKKRDDYEAHRALLENFRTAAGPKS